MKFPKMKMKFFRTLKMPKLNVKKKMSTFTNLMVKYFQINNNMG